MVTMILGCIFGVFYFIIHNKIRSGNIYFLMLACMLLPPYLSKDGVLSSWIHPVNPFNIVVLGLCLCFGFIPWMIFDENIKYKKFYVPDESIRWFEIIFRWIIVLSLFSIFYLTPTAIKSIMLGASNVRDLLYTQEYNLLPKSPLTTVAVATAALNIYCILFFFISCLSERLKTYRIWLIISSFSYVVNCMAISARDGLVLVPLLYMAFYLVFRKSLNWNLGKRIKKRIKTIIYVAGIVLLVFSLSRFSGNKEKIDWNSVYNGTAGYICQQPYVFDDTIENQDDFWGFECRFPLINRILGIPEYEVNRRDNYFEWSFGTMYAENYSAFGWIGLIFISMSFIIYYSFSIRWLGKNRKWFGLLLMFTVYAFIAITGMFYTRVGANTNLNIFYFALSIIPFFTKNTLISIK